MRKNKMKFRTLAVTLSVASVLAMSVPAYAAEVPSSTTITQNTITKSAKNMFRDLATRGVDEVAKLIPGGTILAMPFKAVLGKLLEHVDDISNKALLEEINKNFDKISKQIDAVSAQINDLSAKLDEKTGILAKRIETGFNLASLREDIKALNYDIHELYKDIQDIIERKEDGKITDDQALVEMAELFKATRMDDLKFRIFNLKNSMSGKGGLIYADFYETIYNVYAKDYLFSGEFFDLAKQDADALTAQYLLGCGLLTICQSTIPELAEFTEEQKEALGAKYIARYEDIMEKQNRLEKDAKDTVEAVNSVVEGYQKFYNDNRDQYFVNYGLEKTKIDNAKVTVEFKNSLKKEKDRPSYYPTSDEIIEIWMNVKKRVEGMYFTPDKMKKIVAYIRKKYPGKSVREAFKLMTGVDIEGKYILTDPNPKQVVEKNDYGNFGTLGAKCGIYYMVIDVDDKTCTEKDTKLAGTGSGTFAGRNAYNEAGMTAFYNGTFELCCLDIMQTLKQVPAVPCPQIFGIEEKHIINTMFITANGPRIGGLKFNGINITW